MSAYAIAYHLLMVIVGIKYSSELTRQDASVSSIYLMIQESSADIVKGNLPPLKRVGQFCVRKATEANEVAS